jgi:phage FluMu protein Com
METIKIKCPNCGAILAVVDSPANVGKSVKCPVCKVSNLFSNFKSVRPKISEEEDRTNLGPNLCSEDKTCLPELNKVEKIGYLWDNSNNTRYNLKEGVNLIGRMTYQSAPVATVPVKTDDRGFSRKHMNIEVVKGSDQVFRYYVYNAENKNPTTVNGVLIGTNDKIILHNGDLIKSSSTELVLKIE